MASFSSPYLIFGYWLAVLLLQTATFFPLTYSMVKKTNSLAFHFLFYLCTVLIESLSTIITTTYTLILWSPDSQGYDPTSIFIIGFISYCFVPVTSAAVLFLLLHRIIVVNFWESIIVNKILNILAVVVISGMIILNSSYVILNFLNTIPKLNGIKCWIIHCTWGEGGSAVHLWGRMIFGFANVVAGIVFLAALKKSSAGNSLSQRANRLTLITIASELILSFLPTAIDLFISNVFGIFIVQTIGPIGFLTCAMDAAVVSFIYSRFFMKSSQNRVISMPRIRTY